MDFRTFFKSNTPHIVAILVCFIVMLAYFSPILGGKALKQFDVKQWRAAYQEIHLFEQASGERTYWTNSMFSGMPTYLIGASYSYNVLGVINFYLGKVLMGDPLHTMVLLYLCFYIALIVFGVNPWLSIIGALAFSFSSFNLINLDAGHATKGLAIAFMPLVLGGIKLVLSNKRLPGAVMVGFSLGLHLAAGHLQITYYLLMMILVWLSFEFVIAIKQKLLANLIKSYVFILIAALLAVGTNITNLLVTSEYTKFTIRTPTELKRAEKEAGEDTKKSTGLDKDYAFDYSYQVTEPLTALIPNFYGGAMVGDASSQAIMAKEFKAAGLQQAKELAKGLPSYFGDQPYTAGPSYFGAIICFLFVLGLFLIKGPQKWWIVVITTLAICLTMGKNFSLLSDFFFYYVPLYSKFRSVTFIFVIAQTTFPLLGLLALNELVQGKLNKNEVTKALYYSLAITGGICLLFVIMPQFISVNSDGTDKQLIQYNYPMDAIYSARAAVRQMDALRSLFFIVLGFGVIWFYLQGKLKINYLAGILALLVIIDLWGVDKRFLNDTDFEKKKKEEVVVEKTPADEFILRDKDPHYRVYNTTQRLDQDALTSYYHKSIGGYHGAKLRRYQELIQYQISQQNMEIFNMLNVKYFIIGDSLNNLYPQQNTNARGNAWFVNKPVFVDGPDAELDSLTGFNAVQTCYIDKRFSDQLIGLTILPDSAASIKLTSYAPNKLTYLSETSTPQLAVFSEIYYDKGWNAYIDGVLVPHLRCNYVLRGLRIPQGKHEIVFKFEPEVVKTGETISLISSVLLCGGVLAYLLSYFIQKRKKTA
ncbi:MAG: hypothetical protein EAY81_09200 [Bacteroidetes bacterium]|nr:MAG: hypothetical protein EAY81_09200 [Bacteroidota bacterium]